MISEIKTPSADSGSSARNLGHVLVVDDEERNRRLLGDLLKVKGYTVTEAVDGEDALRSAEKQPPDIILLDIMMPKLDGFSTCQRLKEIRHLSRIPIIFLSALEHVEDKVKAFAVGGVDYVTKPFRLPELLSRVSTHVALKKAEEQLESQNAHLEELVRQRTHELAEAHDRLKVADAAKADFLKLVSHELRTPATGILGITEVVFDSCPEGEDMDELRSMFDQACDRMLDTLDNALLLARIHVSKEDFKAVPVVLDDLMAEAVPAARELGCCLNDSFASPPEAGVTIAGDVLLLKTAIVSLLQTVAAFSKDSGGVSLAYQDESSFTTIILGAQGESLEEETMAKFFDVYGSVRTYSSAEPLGLKPAVAERIVSLYGGRVEMAALPPQGIQMRIALHKSS